MRIGQSLVNAATIACAVSALLVTSLVVRRELRPAAPDVPAPKLIPSNEWSSLVTSGHRIGPSDAKLTIVEFGDFECPACAAFARNVLKFRRAHSDEVAIIFHHWPLDYHESAMPLAQGAVCADAQGVFAAYHDSVYANHRSIGKTPVMQFARRAGISDTMRFAECLTSQTTASRIQEDVASVRRIGGGGTPTIVIDGKMYRQMIDSAFLERMLASKARSSKR